MCSSEEEKSLVSFVFSANDHKLLSLPIPLVIVPLEIQISSKQVWPPNDWFHCHKCFRGSKVKQFVLALPVQYLSEGEVRRRCEGNFNPDISCICVFQGQSELQWCSGWEGSLCWPARFHGKSYIFYEMVNSYDLTRTNSYDFFIWIHMNSYEELPIRMNLYEWPTPNPAPKPTLHWGLDKEWGRTN